MAKLRDATLGLWGNWRRAGSVGVCRGTRSVSAEGRVCLDPPDFLTLMEGKDC